MPSVAIMARVARIPSYPSPRLYSSSTSLSSRFHVNRFPASRVRFFQFQSSSPEGKRQGTHSGPSTPWSARLSRSSQQIRMMFVKFLESQRWFSGKINALLQTNFGLGLATIFAGSLGNVAYAQYSNHIREKRLHSALAMGTVPDVENKENLVERQGATRAIKSILKPQGDYTYYDMIVGKHGTGKTTLVRHVGHQLDGVLYVNISPNGVTDKAFAQVFAKAFNWTPATRFWLDTLLSYWGISDGEVADDRALLVMVFKEFHKQAKVFKKDKGRPPVLVLDNVNRLSQDNPKLLNILQDIAKDAADDSLFTTVFVSSEGEAPIQMLGRSASSRLGQVMEIGDLTHDETLDYLCNKRAISKSVAEDICGLVGGRAGLLKRAVNMLNSGLDFPGVQELFLGDANQVLQNGGMEEGAQFRVAGIQIANHVLQYGRISRKDFYRISGSKSLGDQLLSLNIFTTVPRSQWVFFDTRPMEIAVRELVENAGDEIATVKFPKTRK